MSNGFLEALQSHDWFTENGAVSHSTTGDAVLDYFSKSATYSGRDPVEVAGSLSRSWADSPLLTLTTIFYNRMITRSPSGFATIEKVQSGQGMRDEFRKALKWLHVAHPEALYENLWLVPVVGVWKDLWNYDTVDVLDAQRVYELVERGIADDFNRPLIAKYLPRIRSKSKITQPRHLAFNNWARGLCAELGWSERDYRKFKSDPQNRAHLWQRQMSAGLWEEIDFNSIPGKALFKLVNNAGADEVGALERHVRDELLAWAESADSVKFTGFVYELVRAARNPKLNWVQRTITDKQFEGLIAAANQDRVGLTENLWCALDTSGSMSVQSVAGTTAFEICVGMGVYFSTLNKGAFHNQVIMFDSTSRIRSLNGSFTDKVQQILSGGWAMGSTNFQSVIDEIVRVRVANPDIPVGDFPTTLLVVSDMQFNPSGEASAETNYEAAMRKLVEVGLPRVRIVWWWVNGRGTDFPAKFDDEGVIMISGFDGSIVSLLLGGDAANSKGSPIAGSATAASGVATPVQAMLKALDQPVLRRLRIPGEVDQLEGVNSN